MIKEKRMAQKNISFLKYNLLVLMTSVSSPSEQIKCQISRPTNLIMKISLTFFHCIAFLEDFTDMPFSGFFFSKIGPLGG